MAIFSLPEKCITVGYDRSSLFRAHLSAVTVVDSRGCVSLVQCVVAYLDNHELCYDKGSAPVS